MRKCGLGAVQQRGIVVFYDDVIVGDFTADLPVEDQDIVELKVVSALSDVHLPQCRNFLRATGKPPCLLINFGPGQSRNPPHDRRGVIHPLHPQYPLHPPLKACPLPPHCPTDPRKERSPALWPAGLGLPRYEAAGWLLCTGWGTSPSDVGTGEKAAFQGG